jgi:anti-sigma factor RsiW
MTHEEASELIASFALDAVEPDESGQIEAHLADCPRCRAELDAHREVAAALGNSVEPLPEGLWSGISSRLPERPDEETPPMPRLLLEEFSEDGDGRVLRLERPQRFRPTRGRLATIGAVAVAAAAAAAVLGINLVRADNHVSQLQGVIGTAAPTAVEAALETPGHRVVDLDSAAHHQLAQFVLVPDGRGYLVSSTLPGLSSQSTYQLWAVIKGQPISIGLLGQSPSQVTFTVNTMEGTPGPSRLGITVEPSGGSVVPSSPMVASGTV